MTPEWVAAGAGVAAAAIALTALAFTLSLFRKQAKSLKVTIDALTDEMARRNEEREQERRLQARETRLDLTTGDLEVSDQDRVRLESLLAPSGLDVNQLQAKATFTNDSSRVIRNVWLQAWQREPRCYVLDGEMHAGVGAVPVVSAGRSVRFYWAREVSPLKLYAEFEDEVGVRWCLHHRDGLSEVSSQE